MSHTPHDGTFHDDQTYTNKAIARILGKKEDWVRQYMLEPDDGKDGIPYQRLGQLYLVAGINIRLWNERNSQ